MSRRKKDPLRPLTEQEYQYLRPLSRSQTAPALEVARAKMLLLISEGLNYKDAVAAVGMRSRHAASLLVSRFNQESLDALVPRHGGGRPILYGEQQRERILTELARTPTPEHDGCSHWSLSTLQRAIREAPDGLPRVSTHTLWRVIRQEGRTHQKNRTWCETGTVLRQRKDGVVAVTDPDTQSKKT